MDYEEVKNVINNFERSTIQSEAEVSSKFIHPLFKALGYSDELFAQEFPVYGYAGSEPLRAKNADFIYFQNKEFALYKTNTLANRKWVEENTLLVVEAKKPGRISDDIGQAVFYAAWTKAIAYIITDGVLFRAFIRSDSSSDHPVIDTTVSDLVNHPKLSFLEFDCLRKLKGELHSRVNNSISVVDKECSCIISKDEDLHLPPQTISYMKNCLGKNALGLTNVQIVSRYLNMTDCYLANSIRYDIPPYMISIPRMMCDAHIYLDNSVFPLISGKAVRYYRNEEVRFVFKSEYIEIGIQISSNKVVAYDIGCHMLDKSVDKRISSFNLVKQIFDANKIVLNIENYEIKVITLPDADEKNMWPSKKTTLKLFELWFDSLMKLKEIEEFYGIKFSLKHGLNREEQIQMYVAIDVVLDGIKHRENCFLSIPAESISEDIQIEFPELIEKDIPRTLKTYTIHDVVFIPKRLTLLPCEIKKSETETIRLPACCEYRIENGDG